MNDGACGGHDHDDEDEFWFGEVELSFDVFDGVVDGPVGGGVGEEHDGGPEAEDDFCFREEVQQVFLQRSLGVVVCPLGEFFDHEGVDHSDGEESGRENFHEHGLNELLSGGRISGGRGVDGGDDEREIEQ